MEKQNNKKRSSNHVDSVVVEQQISPPDINPWKKSKFLL